MSVTESIAPELFTTTEVAERFSVKRSTVVAWIKSGELPAINVATGNRTLPLYRVTAADLSAWVEARRQKGQVEGGD